MDNERCPYCQTPYSSDLDENGNPFCDCDGSRIAELEAEIARLRKKVERASVLLGLERAARLTVEERLKSLRSQYDIWRELNPDNDDNSAVPQEHALVEEHNAVSTENAITNNLVSETVPEDKPKKLTKKQLEKKFKDELLKVREKTEGKK